MGISYKHGHLSEVKAMAFPMAFLTQSGKITSGVESPARKNARQFLIIRAGIESLLIFIGHIPIFVQKTPNWSVAEKPISSINLYTTDRLSWVDSHHQSSVVHHTWV